MKHLFSLFVVIGLFQPAPARSAEPVSVLLFSAPWCSDCRRELPAIQKEFDDKLKAHVGKFKVSVLVETGKTPSAKPTQADADAFRASLAMQFPFTPDAWKWATYRKYFVQLGVPAAVVLDAKGDVLRKFEVDSFTAAQLADFVVSVVK